MNIFSNNFQIVPAVSEKKTFFKVFYIHIDRKIVPADFFKFLYIHTGKINPDPGDHVLLTVIQ